MNEPNASSPVRMGILIRTLWPGSFARISIEESSGLNQTERARATVLAFSEQSSSYHYADLILKRKSPVSLANCPGAIRAISSVLLRPFTPSIRDVESVVPGFEILWWGLFDKSDFDVLYCEDQLAGVAALIRKKLRSTPYVVFVAEPVSHKEGIVTLKAARTRAVARVLKGLLGWIEYRTLLEASGICFVSRRTERAMAVLFPQIGRFRTRVLYPGCHPLDARPVPATGPGYLLCVSKWDFGRRPEFVFSVASLLDTEIKLAGSWVNAESQGKFLTKLQTIPETIRRRIIVTGPISEDELAGLYRDAYAYIHWSPEGFGMGIVEALAMGIPVVCSSDAGGAELIESGRNGLIVSDNNPEAYAAAIKMLLDAPALRNRLAEGAWQSSKDLSWESHNRLLFEFLTGGGSKVEPTGHANCAIEAGPMTPP